MNNLSHIIILISLFCSAITNGQTEVNYEHKLLVKTLQKEGIAEASSLKEMHLDVSISDTDTTSGKYFSIDNNENSLYHYAYIGRVNSCRAGSCSISNDNGDGCSSEYFDYFILFNKDKSVQMVSVFNYQATHGHEITAKGWLKQFVGHNGKEDIKVNKNIDAISGATVSVNAITDDVRIRIQALNQQ